TLDDPRALLLAREGAKHAETTVDRVSGVAALARAEERLAHVAWLDALDQVVTEERGPPRDGGAVRARGRRAHLAPLAGEPRSERFTEPRRARRDASRARAEPCGALVRADSRCVL